MLLYKYSTRKEEIVMTAVEKEQLVNQLELKAGLIRNLLFGNDDENLVEEGWILLDLFNDAVQNGTSTTEAMCLLEDMENFLN